MSYENHISLNHYWITCQMLCTCVCVTLSKFQNGKDKSDKRCMESESKQPHNFALTLPESPNLK